MSGTYINLPVSSGGGSGFVTSVTDTNSIDLTVLGGNLTADLRLSANAASAGFFKATTTIKTTGSVGLHVELPIATTILTGVISSTDWNTFNNKQDPVSATAPITFISNTIAIPKADATHDGYISQGDWSTFNSKEPPITPGSVTDYYRGDKTFQPLNLRALTSITDGSSAAAGQLGRIISATQSTNTTTGIGASGVYGSVISLSVPAGVWFIWGSTGFNENGAVLTDGLQTGISASPSGAGISEFDTALDNGLISGTSDLILNAPGIIVSLAAPTTYYLNSKFNYTSGTPRHRGRIQAWLIS